MKDDKEEEITVHVEGPRTEFDEDWSRLVLKRQSAAMRKLLIGLALVWGLVLALCWAVYYFEL